MNIAEKIERSKSSERIDFTKIACLEIVEPLMPVLPTAKILVEPIWTVAGDLEGSLYAEYISEHPRYDGVYVRESLLERMHGAAESLPSNLSLVVHTGHRPPDVQRQLLRECMRDYKNKHPTASDEDALTHARLYVSDPDIKLPPHCCGAAVDVGLFDTHRNAYVDFGSRLNLDEEISHLHSVRINPEQRSNRILLLETMLKAGFSSYYAEWWHYSYGDEIWAWFYGMDSCLYGIAEI